MSVVVTGAAGYVGGRLVRHLRDEGMAVVPTVRRPVPWLTGAHPVDLVAGDLGGLVGVLEGHDAVVHLAGASEVRAGAEPDAALAETVVATRRVAEAAVRAGVRRLVFLSTFHVYGGATDDGGVHEGVVPTPRHPYAFARLAGEHLAAGCGPDHGVALRLTNAVGPPVDARVDRWTLVANDLCAQAVAGGPLRLRSSGHDGRDFVDLGDACRAIGAAATGVVPAGTYNLGSGTTTRVLDLAHLVADAAEEVLGARPPVDAPAPTGPEPARFRVDVSRLAAVVPLPPPDLRAALVATIRAVAAAGRRPGPDATTPEA